MKKFILLFLVSLLTTIQAFAGDVWVNGYTKKDGTQVQGHYRSAPNNNAYDNWSTKGNTNPYTGQKGTKNVYPNYGNNYDAPLNNSRSNNKSIWGN